jgi:hypothetical protein
MGSHGMSGDGWAAYGGKPRGPYGTNEGDIWLGVDSPVGQMLKERQGTTLIHEMLRKDGKVQEVIYHTDNQELIDMATKGHEKYVRAVIEAQARNN